MHVVVVHHRLHFQLPIQALPADVRQALLLASGRDDLADPNDLARAVSVQETLQLVAYLFVQLVVILRAVRLFHQLDEFAAAFQVREIIHFRHAGGLFFDATRDLGVRVPHLEC